MEHILKPEEVRTLGRPIGKVADEKLTAFITEAEQLHIKPIIGDELFYRILNEEQDNNIKLLLSGGNYRDKREKIHGFMGLRVALSYFVFAQNLMSGDIESTRFGSVIKNDDYSSKLSSRERSDAYNNAMEVANAYLQECVSFCREVGLIKVVGKTKLAVGGVTIRKIGV